MAGDWIKMRVMLARDPKVIAMSESLAMNKGFMAWLTDPVQQRCQESAYEHVTSHVLRSVTVTALLLIWGMCAERGKRDNGHDLTVTHATISTLDDIADVVGIGEAMLSVGWVEERPDGSLVFPNYLLEGSCASDRAAEREAEQAKIRKRRQRDRERDIDRDRPRDQSVTPKRDIGVTVTTREEKRREDDSRAKASIAQDIALCIAGKDAPGDACSLLARAGVDPEAIRHILSKPGVDLCAVEWAVTRLTEELRKKTPIDNPAGFVRSLAESGPVPRRWRDGWQKRRIAAQAASMNGRVA